MNLQVEDQKLGAQEAERSHKLSVSSYITGPSVCYPSVPTPFELGGQGLEDRDRAALSTTESTQTRTVVDLNVSTGAAFTVGAGISRFEAEVGDDVEGGNEHGSADGVEARA
ncbi:hypothetical protein TWF102_010308 [Orbilia oligospora]|uniref:Uncharacterized protein n=1 Tax=Orbilia oligospora TaxID=2813651 RepID=A0A7C8J4C4_ORBOL|nr:hypothetical protein TWF102_010308 [Orbilia oligospora]